MIKLFHNWYQLRDNGLWERYYFVSLPRLLEFVQAGARMRLGPDGTVYGVAGPLLSFKFKLEGPAVDAIVDTIYPALE